MRLNISLGVSMRVFLGEINMWISGLSKVNGLSQCGLASNPWKGWVRGAQSARLPFSWDSDWSSPAFQLELRLELTPLVLLGFQFAG